MVKTTVERAATIFRRDGRFADMVMAELAGRFEAPLYGMLEVARRIDAHDWGALPKPSISLHGQPSDESRPTLLWDGEWEITYVTFRDMGAAFGAAILGIYVLVVAQFRSFRLPLVILTPIPLTLIGIPDRSLAARRAVHRDLDDGFIALAGIIVRNSILLIDFIRHSGGAQTVARDVVLEAGAVRFKPILLTALAAAMIAPRPFFSTRSFRDWRFRCCSGLASSTLLTALVIPAIYIALREPAPPLRRKCILKAVSARRSSVGVGYSRFVQNLRLRLLPEVMQHDAAGHGCDKHEHAWRERREAFQGRPWAQANEPPADTE